MATPAPDKPPVSLPQPMRPFGLAIKITLPFLALFALLLLALGIVVARGILAEVEAQVENKQRFVLEVCSFRGFAFEEDMLRDIRTLGGGVTFGDIVILEDGGRKLTTLPHADPNTGRVMDDLQAQIVKHPGLTAEDSGIKRMRLMLNGQDWMVLYTSRPTRGASPVKRYFYLLYPFAQIEQAKNSALTRLIALGGAGLFLAALLGLLIAQWISRPVRRLATAAQQISTSGLSDTLDPALSSVSAEKKGDEIHHLALAFRSMVESLKRSQGELLKAERLAATGKLAASVAHEIRNPLTSLRMTVEMLAQRPSNDAATQEAYRIVLNEIDRLALAVEELLTFARPRPPQRVPTDLNQLIRDTLKFMERQMAHAHVSAETEPDASLPQDLALDPNKIRQLLVNLLLNAQQAIVRNGTIRVNTVWDAAASTLTLSVADTGPGIPPEVRERVFELFVSTKTGGGGLGLTIARQIVEEHGGTIAFTTSTSGTTFKVTLPGQRMPSVSAPVLSSSAQV